MPVDVENSTTCPKCGQEPPMNVQFHMESDADETHTASKAVGLSCPHCFYGANGEWSVSVSPVATPA